MFKLPELVCYSVAKQVCSSSKEDGKDGKDGKDEMDEMDETMSTLVCGALRPGEVGVVENRVVGILAADRVGGRVLATFLNRFNEVLTANACTAMPVTIYTSVEVATEELETVRLVESYLARRWIAFRTKPHPTMTTPQENGSETTAAVVRLVEIVAQHNIESDRKKKSKLLRRSPTVELMARELPRLDRYSEIVSQHNW